MTKLPASLREAAGLVERREISPVELTRACLDRIAAGNGELRAFITVMEERALAVAEGTARAVYWPMRILLFALYPVVLGLDGIGAVEHLGSQRLQGLHGTGRGGGKQRPQQRGS